MAQSAIYSAAVVSGDYTLRRHGATKTDVITADMFPMVKQVSDIIKNFKMKILSSSFQEKTLHNLSKVIYFT